jgi:hypothetical protein
MFGFAKKLSQYGPVFTIGNSSLFLKNRLTPKEYGYEIARLGFMFASEQLRQYRQCTDHDENDTKLITSVSYNPMLFECLYSDLIIGGFLCHAIMILKCNKDISLSIEEGVLDALRAKLDGWDDWTITTHKDIAANFAIALEREMSQIDENAIENLMRQYIELFYPNLRMSISDGLPAILQSFIIGLGSRFVVICEKDFKIRLN